MLQRPFSSSLSLWRDMDRLRREMNRLLAGTPTSFGARTTFPAINMWTNEDGAFITAELPGVDPEEIDISVSDDTLTLVGSRQLEELDEDVVYHRRERGYGSFSRTFQLPFQVESDEVEATYQNGVLHITLPRAEEEKPKRIQIKQE